METFVSLSPHFRHEAGCDALLFSQERGGKGARLELHWLVGIAEGSGAKRYKNGAAILSQPQTPSRFLPSEHSPHPYLDHLVTELRFAYPYHISRQVFIYLC